MRRRTPRTLTLAVTVWSLTQIGVATPQDRRAVEPPPREEMGFAFDSATGQLVMFGGYDGSYHLADTWTWDGTAWTEQHPAHHPPTRCCMAMAYDPLQQTVVLFGGGDANGWFGDTWTWDGVDWTLRQPATSPPADCCSAMAMDAKTGKLVLAESNQGQTWTWDGSDWTLERTGASNLWYQSMARFGPHIVIFGGEMCLDSCFYRNETSVWNGSVWARVHPAMHPGPRSQAGIAYDESHGRDVLFGGEPGWGDTWVFDGINWIQQHPPSSPSARAAPGMAFDNARHQVVLFGGLEIGGFQSDTWTWDGSTWTCVAGCV